ncbi:MAG: hypothetical protein AAF481_14385 [Acidobacteriota bacterium]
MQVVSSPSMPPPESRPERLGSQRVDVFVTANLGIFGFVQPNGFSGAALGDKTTEALSAVLKNFSFPSLNLAFAASARLRPRSSTSMVTGTKLQEMELRVILEALEQTDGPAPPDGEPLIKILGLEPSETLARVIEERPEDGFRPSSTSLGYSSKGRSYNLSYTYVPRRRTIQLEKATLAAPDEFGWYLRSSGAEQKEGLHYGTAFLQLSRKVKRLRVKVGLASDWTNGVPNQIEDFTIDLGVHHPPIPKTPQLTDVTDMRSLPIVIPRDDIKTLLAITDEELSRLISNKDLRAFGSEGKLITKGSLSRLLGL